MNLIDIYKKWEEKRDKQILSFLDHNPDSKVVDLGCGNAEFSLIMKKQIGCKEIYGVDIWDDALKKARENRIICIKNDLNEKLRLDDESFDIVISNQVLEHLWYPIQFIREIYRILRKEGLAVISTENLGSWDNICSLVFGWTPFSMQFDSYSNIGNPVSPHKGERFDEYPPHTRIFTYRGLKSTFEEIGFEVVDIKGSGYLPFNFISSIDSCHSRFLTIKVRK